MRTTELSLTAHDGEQTPSRITRKAETDPQGSPESIAKGDLSGALVPT